MIISSLRILIIGYMVELETKLSLVCLSLQFSEHL